MADRVYLAAARRDRLPTALVWGAAALVAALFVWIVGDIVYHGLAPLSWAFLSQAPADAGRAGGIAPILVSTLYILGVCLLVAVPIGLATALLLAEFSAADSRFGRVIRRSLDVLAATPSIVFGLFGFAFFSVFLGLGFSILAGGLTLACMVLPILIRAVEAGLRAVPDDYRFGAAALGLTRSAAIRHLLLPAAVPGLVVGLVLGIGRALAETAALLYTSGYVDRMPDSLLDSGRTLSIHIYELSMNIPGGNPNAYASALVLVLLLLVINSCAVWLTERWLNNRLVAL